MISGYEYPVVVFKYIANSGNIPDKAAFADTVERVLPGKAGEEVMTIVEMYRHEGKQEGLQEGLYRGKEEGLQEGLIEGKIEVAKRLLSKGMAIDTIAEITELSAEKLQALQNEVMH